MKSVNNVQIVGDDLYVTNLERLKKGFLNIKDFRYRIFLCFISMVYYM